MQEKELQGLIDRVVDGKLSPEGFATAIRQAVAGGADVLVPVGISCSAAAASRNPYWPSWPSACATSSRACACLVW